MQVTIQPTPKQHLAWKALQDNECKYPVFGGGAGGGKSWLGCEWLLTNCYMYPGYKGFIGREELSRLKKSTYVTFLKVCSFHNIPKTDWRFNGQDNYIEFINGQAKGSRIDLLDLVYKPSDPLYERFGSLEYSSGWVEEAGETKFLAFDVLKSRIGRHLNRELNIPIKMLVTCNPKKNWLYKYVYQPYKNGTLGKEFKFIQSLYHDNPYTADAYGEQLLSIKDRATKERLMKGNWEYDDDPSTLINFNAINDLFTNSVDSGEKFITADIARYGSDKIVIMVWNGWKVEEIKFFEKQATTITADKIREIANEKQIPYSHIVVDEDGVGGGVVDQLLGINGFVNNSSPLENPQSGKKEEYRNLKSQCYFILADKINNHQVAINCNDFTVRELLTEELEVVKSKDADKDSKLQVLGKDEIKELIGRSPDFSDALMMRVYFDLERISSDDKDEEFSIY